MPSQALLDLQERLKDIDQLLQAHAALTKFHRAEKAAKKTGGALGNLAEVVKVLVNKPGKGKPAEVAAINRGAFVMLLSHFQGFVDDLHKEAAQHILAGKVTSVTDIVDLVRPRNANPHVDIIERMFCGIGVYEIMKGIKWKNCENQKVKTRLKKYIEERNNIAHGKRPQIHKTKVIQFLDYIHLLAESLDAKACAGIHTATGTKPW